MGTNISLIHNLQELYASCTGLSVHVLDKSGKLVTDVTSIDPLTDLVLNHNKYQLTELLHQCSKANSYMIDDGLYGLKQIFVPVKCKQQIEFFIWSGPFIEENSLDSIIHFINDTMDSAENWINAVMAQQEVDEAKKQAYIAYLKQVASLIESAMDDEYLANRASDVSKLLARYTAGPDSSSNLLVECLETFQDLDFIGIASGDDENEQFTINELYGGCNERLRNKSFSIGEGFIGQTIAKNKAMYWSNIQFDPRATSFVMDEKRLKNLYCIPISGTVSEVQEIVFVGAYDDEISENTRNFLTSFMKIKELQEMNGILSRNRESLNIRLGTILDVSELLTEFQDLKRILFTLVDMSLNMVQGSFACVFLRNDSHNDKAKIVSRGVTPEQIKTVGKHLSDKYFISTDWRNEGKSSIYMTNWGAIAIETPIYYQDKLFGVLCVGLNHKNEYNEFRTLLSSLAIMAGIAFHNHSLENAQVGPSNQVNALHLSMKQWNPNGFKQTEEARGIATSFAKFINYNEQLIEELKTACSLAFYAPDILRQVGIKQSTVEIIEQYQSKVFVSETSQIMYLLFEYIQNDYTLSLDTTFKDKIDRNLYDVFIDFINKYRFVDEEVDLERATGNHEQKITTYLSNMKKAKLLTLREVEVLGLIIKGLNNREIAEKLVISEHTVKNHVTNIFQKLNVQDRTQAITYVYQGVK